MTPWDLLQGTSLKYDADVSAGMVSVTTNPNEFQMTTGCGLALYLWRDQAAAACFPVIKNSYQWEAFCASNTEALQHALQEKAKAHKVYSVPRGLQVDGMTIWRFTLAGYWGRPVGDGWGPWEPCTDV